MAHSMASLKLDCSAQSASPAPFQNGQPLEISQVSILRAAKGGRPQLQTLEQNLSSLIKVEGARTWVYPICAKRTPYSHQETSPMTRQHTPDRRVFLPQYPRAKSLEPALFHQLIPLTESAFICKEDPLPHIVAVEPGPRCTVYRVPLDPPAIGLRQVQCILPANIFRTRVRLVILGRSGKPVIPIKRNPKRELLFRDHLQRVIQIFHRPAPSAHRTRRRPARVLVIGHQANQVYRFRQRLQIVSSAPVRINPCRKRTLPRRPRSIRHRRNRELQPLPMQCLRRFCNNVAQRVPVRPRDVFKIKLKAGVAVLFADSNQLPDHMVPRSRGRNQPMKRRLLKTAAGSNRHYLQVVLFCRR